MQEFKIIERYFKPLALKKAGVVVGTGDDAAMLAPFRKKTLVVTTDTLLEGRHFLKNTPAHAVGYRALAVNLSDLAAMGATPYAVTIALTLPRAKKAWLQAFAAGLKVLLKKHRVALIGGNLSRGPLSITVQALGYLPKKHGLLRSHAKPGDLIYVTGTLGGAALALKTLTTRFPAPNKRALLKRLYYPTPRIACGEALCRYAHAAIDLSDGLAADLTHILKASQVSGVIDLAQLPIHPTVKKTLAQKNAIELALNAGDDYELCFTAPKKHAQKITQLMKKLRVRCTAIGYIKKGRPILDLIDETGRKQKLDRQGYEHF